MFCYLSYDKEMKKLWKLINEVSTDEESISEEYKEIVDKEQLSKQD